MPDWRKLVADHHQWAHAKDSYELVTLPPASPANLEVLQGVFGLPLPAELRDFYSQLGGFGVQAPGGEVSWFVVPHDQVVATIEAARDWFADTHPELASRFFPFIDWSCGDYTGYLQSSDGTLDKGLYTFEHENYEFDEDQEESEFLLSVYQSLEDVLATD